VKIVEDGKSDGVFSPRLDTRITVFGILGALNWIPEWYSDKGPASAGEIADKLAEALIFGLREGPAWSQSGSSVAPIRADRVLATRKRATAAKSRA
jgi:hypothetical protein